LVVLPCGTIAGAVLWTATVSIGLVAVLFGLAVLDALRGLNRLDGIIVESPEVVRLSHGREGPIRLRIRNEKKRAGRLRLGLPLPRQILTPSRDLSVILSPEREISFASWSIKAYERGQYTIETCYLEAASPLGFWAVRSTLPISLEVRVYPNLIGERKHLAALFLNRGLSGIHVQRQIGKGREFQELRDYIPGDSLEDIHWKTTAKRGSPITKIFQIERTQEVYVVIDASRLSARRVDYLLGEGPEKEPVPNGVTTSILDRFVTAALVMGLATEKQGDQFGILAYHDGVGRFVRAKNGKVHYTTCRDALYQLKPRIVTPDFSEVFAFLGLNLRRRALIVFLSSLDDSVLAEAFAQNLEILCRRHLVLVNMLKPEKARPLFSGPQVESIDEVYECLGGHVLWARLRELERLLHRQGVRFSLLDNEMMCAQLVSQYIDIKRRQLL
jgi:uncharacterized protein (DUF58 family)